MSASRGRFLTQTLGPGLLFAGAAVGVSHLVQSTRAGAVYGLGLVVIILAANVLKYPAFQFGPRYAAATGTSLLEGYRRQGRWALVLYTVLTLGTMFSVLAAVTVVTASLALALLDVQASVVLVSAAIIAVCTVILAAGKYHALDLVMKVVVAALTLMTFAATILVLPRIDWGAMTLWPSPWTDQTSQFVAPLMGWMPSAIDIAVWHSLWTLAKRRDTRHAASVRESLLDFDIGYVGTALLAICFVLMGAGVMFGTGVAPAEGGGAFARQVIGLYTQSLGAWSEYLIGTCAFMVMFSTTLTVVDGFPRALASLVERYRGPEEPGAEAETPLFRKSYWAGVAVISVGAVLLLHFFLTGRNFKTFIDVATALAFVTGPVLATLNHRAVFGPEMPAEHRPGPAMRVFSLIAIASLAAMALWWLSVRFG